MGQAVPAPSAAAPNRLAAPAPAGRQEVSPAATSPQPTAPTPEAAPAVEIVRLVREQIGRAVVGQEEVVDQVLAALLAGGHVLLEGVPGVGKTLLALALARTFGGRFSRVQLTSDLMPSDITGHSIFRPDLGEFKIRRGPVFTHLLLADEINRAPAKTQAALLEAMQEQQVSIEGASFPLEPPFMVLATQNPLEHEGTYPLPEAQLDRFLMKILVVYPSEEEEVDIVRRVTSGRPGDKLDVARVSRMVDPEGVLALQQETARLLVDDRVLEYAVRLVRRSRTWSGFRLGTGPRGAIALVRVARAFAILAGRDHVLPDDVKRAAYPVLRHRVMLAPEMEMSGQTADQALASLIEDVEAPRR